jgi:heme a synthase
MRFRMLELQLGLAFTLYSALVWQGLSLVRSARDVTPLPQAAKDAALKLRGTAALTTAVIAVTVASGAFVAGNDAGHAFNDWPFFAGRVIPEGIWSEQLGLRNFTENTATVQWDHRLLAYSTLGAVGLLHAQIARVGSRILPTSVRTAARILGGLAVAQVCCGGLDDWFSCSMLPSRVKAERSLAVYSVQVVLGVSTLVLFVPVSLGAAHQAGALALLTGAVNLLHAVRAAANSPGLAGVPVAKMTAAPLTSSRLAALPLLFLMVSPHTADTSVGY